MPVSVDTITPSVDATPGALSHGRVLVHNLGSAEATFTVQVVGLDGSSPAPVGPPTAEPSAPAIATVTVPGKSSAECDVPVQVPDDLALGQHAAAFQVTSSVTGERPVLVPFTVAVESVERLDLQVDPTPVRGGRSAGFLLGIHNGEPEPVSFMLDAAATDVSVRFKTPAFRLMPGEHAATKAKIKGPRQLSGEPTQHNIVITARGRASTTSITAPYIQRPVFARKLRVLVGALAVIALWLAAIGGVALWLANRDDGQNQEATATAGDAAAVQLIDANGVPLENGPYSALDDGTIVDVDGNPVDGFTVDENGNVIDADGNPVNGVMVDPESGEIVDENGVPLGLPSADGGDGDGDAGDGVPGSGSDGTGTGSGESGGTGGDVPTQGSTADEADATPVSGLSVPTTTKLRGSVDAGGADLSDVIISLAALDLGAQPPPDATTVDDSSSDAPAQTSAAKIWSARYAPIEVGIGSRRQTEPVPPLEATAGIDGLWEFPDVQLRRTYELSFAKPGFDTQAFVISPPDDGSAVELDVELRPARGVISGRVIDNGSPLGGVQVSLSDGTLTFSTTSATDGDVGTFSFDSVSTPGVYTLVATRSGYGTSVVQLPMDPGEERTDVVVEMDAGVGSISGSVIDEDGRPLGGIAVTATSGEMTRTTTTLTDGNVGFYNIPGLDVPGTYTVSIDTTGYLPQTRRVPISGSIGGVNFALVDTTATLSGVVSSSGGGGIVGASVTLANADLEFDVSSASDPPPEASAFAPQPGAFLVENLPDGNYTVTFEHFEHQTVTEFITVAPGVDPAPLLVTMPVRVSTVNAGFGSLVVEVIDPTGETPEERELTGATVELFETRTMRLERKFEDLSSFSVEIPDIPVGTYTVVVSGVDGYNTAQRLVSIGLSQERREIELLAFGAATGQMVDSFTGEVITGYTVKFYVQDAAGGDEREIGLAEVNVDATGDGVWQTAAQVLPAGIYRVEIVGANGYEEPVDQILQEGLPPMQVLIQPAAAASTQIPTLLANRYPDISGRVYEPRLVPGTDPVTEFDPIDDPELAVGIRCEGGDLFDIETLTDELGAQTGDAFDSFFLTRQVVDREDLLGDCQLEFAAPGYVTKVVDLPGVKVGDANTLSDRIINAALVKPVDDFGGRVYWVDQRDTASGPGTELPLAGVDISADAVVGLDPTLAGPPSPGPIPRTRSEVIRTQSGADGTWTLNGQVFEDALYTFTTDNFAPGSLTVVIDENRNRTVTAGSGLILDEVSPTFYDVELFPPFDGLVSGQASILSIESEPDRDFAGIGLEVIDPSDTTQAVPLTTTGGFSIANAGAGTWTTNFTAPENHVVFGTDPPEITDSVSQLVGPGASVDGFDTTFVELGEIFVRLFDRTSGDPITSGFDLRLTGGGNPPLSEDDVDFLDGILVHPTDPVGTATTYVLEVIIPGYDNSQATVTIDGVPCTADCPNGAAGIELDMLAGSKPEIIVTAPEYGKIVASTRGLINSDGTPIPITEALQPETGDLTVDWDPVDRFGAVLTDFDRGLVSVEPIDDGNATTEDDEFEIRGPPGYYQISVSHPEYETTLLARPTDNCIDVASDPNPCQAPPLGAQAPTIYRLQNDKTNDLSQTGDFELRLRRSEVAISVFNNLTDLVPVAGAEYRLTPADGGTPLIGTLDPAGQPVGATVEDRVVDGMWTLELRKYDTVDTTKNVVYPVIIDIQVTRSTAPTPTVTTVRAPLATLGGVIVGYVTAENSRFETIAFDPAMPPTVIRDYAASQVEENSVLEDNLFNGDGAVDGDDTVPTALTTGTLNTVGPDVECGTVTVGNAPCRRFTIEGLATGPHRLTFSEPDDYTFSYSSNPVTVDVTSTVDDKIAGPFIYTVEDIASVTVTIEGATSNDSFPGLSVLLRPPDGTADIVGTYAAPTPPALPTGPIEVEFTDVPPYSEPYTLVVDDDFHELSDTETRMVDVGPADTPVVLDPLQLVPDVGRITGTIQTQAGLADPIDLGAGGSVSISGPGAPVDDTLDGPRGTYSFDVTATGTYQLLATQSGFEDKSPTSLLTLGQQTVSNIVLRDLATLRVLIADDIAGTTVQYVPRGGSPVAMTKSGTEGTSGVYTANVEGGDEADYRIEVLPPTDPALAAIAGDYNVPARPVIRLPGPDSNDYYEDVSPGSELPLAADQLVTIPRRILVKVLPTGGNVTVAVLSGTTMPSDSGNPNSLFVFTSDGDGIPRTGAIDLRVSRNNYRVLLDQTGDLNDELIEVTQFDDISFTGAVRDAADAPVPDVEVFYTSTAGAGEDDCLTGAVNVDDDDNGDGSFSLDDLTNNNDGTVRTYLFCADVVGAGIGSVSQPVTGATPAGNVTGAFLDLEPEMIDVTFTVYDDRGTDPDVPNAGDPPSIPLSGADVAFNGATATTNASGEATFTVPEDIADLTYDVAGLADFDDIVDADVPAFSDRLRQMIPVAMDVKKQTVTFNVTADAPAGALDDVEITLTGYGTDTTVGGAPATFANVPIDAGPITYSVGLPADYGTVSTTTPDSDDTLYTITDTELRGSETENIRLNVDRRTVTFNVTTDFPSGGLDGVTIALTGFGTDTTAGGGAATFENVPVNSGNLTYGIAGFPADYSTVNTATPASDDTLYNITDTELRGSETENLRLDVTTTSIVFTIENAADNSAINMADVTFFFPGSFATGATSNTVTIDDIPVNAADGGPLPVSVDETPDTYTDPGETVSSTDIDNGTKLIQMSLT